MEAEKVREIVMLLVVAVAWHNGDGDESVPMMILDSLTDLVDACESLRAANGGPIDGLSFHSDVWMVDLAVNSSIP